MSLAHSGPIHRFVKISRTRLWLLSGWVLTVGLGTAFAQDVPALNVVHAGDRICILGNTLAERLQHDGWMESLLQITLPEQKFSMRNLGFSGDELTLRLRSQDFGTPEEWLQRCQATLVFAFFGYNESFAGVEGLPRFRNDLATFIDATRTGSGPSNRPRRLVIFTPIPHEDLRNPHFPSGEEVNARLETYAETMREVCREKSVPCIDLFTLMRGPMRDAKTPLTFNGIHLNSQGNRVLAEVITKQLCGRAPSGNDSERLEQVRRAVIDKDFHWFHRYRTTDGYSIYGGRADLAFVDGQTNREVMHREMEILDQMTAKRDDHIWAIVQGKEHAIDDRDTLPFIPVVTNKPGELPGGAHAFVPGEAAIEKMTVAESMEVRLFASEEQFPELASPVQMAFDPAGRLWVAAWPSYPHWRPKDKVDDKLLIFTDEDDDGHADSMKVFADGLDNPTGFELWGGGVLVAQAPDLWFLKDTDGDDRADVRQRILHGLDSADTHHTANSFTLGPGGELYFQEGTFHHTQVETPWGPPVRNANAGVYRFEPRTGRFEVYVNYGFANPHGHVFDSWGQDFVTDGTGNVNYYAAPFSGHMPFPRKHAGYFPFFQQRIRPAGATELISGGHFGPEYQGDYLIANVIGFQGILRYDVAPDGSGFQGTETDPILFSSDPNFRPVDMEIGPNGALYFIDWQNPIIGHMQHNLRDPSRDKVHGRVYRVHQKDRQLVRVESLAGVPIPKLLEHLKDSANRVRHRARIELSGRDSQEVLAATKVWLSVLTSSGETREHEKLEGLWVFQQHDAPNLELLDQILASSEPKARAAAIRVLCAWRDRFPEEEILRRLETAMRDTFPRVRLEAIRACSFIASPRAAEIALQAVREPLDRFQEYALQETLAALEPVWKPAVAGGRPFAVDNPAGLNFVLRHASTPELLGMFRAPPVLREILAREGIAHADRELALKVLAEKENRAIGDVWLQAIQTLDQSERPTAPAVLADLGHVLSGLGGIKEARHVRQQVEMISTAKLPVTRQILCAALLDQGMSLDEVRALASKSPPLFVDLIEATPLIRDPSVRAAMHPLIQSLWDGPPEFFKAAAEKPVEGRYVRVSLPGENRTLSLAEVQVFSDGRNVAMAGTATQSGTLYGGSSELAIDGNTSPVFADRSMTHTPEGSHEPWWEIDLGKPMPLEKIVVWNRDEEGDELYKRLDGYTVEVLDADRKLVAERKGLPAPRARGETAFQRDWASALRRAAIRAVTWTGVDGKDTFARLADLFLNDVERAESVRGMARLPRAAWSDDQIAPLVANIITRIRGLTTSARSEPDALAELSLARNLALALPADAGAAARRELRELGVQVVVLHPIPHQIAFDRKQVYVEAGKGVEMLLENGDVMPHNLVITSPGALAKVGLAAEAMATQADGYDRDFVPNLPEVLYATKLLQPGQVGRISFTAPKAPGEYPYVCTFPGHWRVMYGTMFVVANLDEVPAEALAPPAEVAASGRAFVKDWKYDELAAILPQATPQRSFDRGKALFTEAACIKCHRLGCDGPEVGPDLKDLQKKLASGEMRRADILREIVEPSIKVDPKFKTWVVTDQDGKVVSGIIASEDATSLQLLTNPLDGSPPVTLAVEGIEDRVESQISLMPQGLLNTLSQEEILDLVWYVEACGDPNHGIYQGSGGNP